VFSPPSRSSSLPPSNFLESQSSLYVETENPVPKKNKTGKPRDVPEDIKEKQKAGYAERDLRDALDRITRGRRDPSAPDRGSAKT
jgi:hypothetical protein